MAAKQSTTLPPIAQAKAPAAADAPSASAAASAHLPPQTFAASAAELAAWHGYLLADDAAAMPLPYCAVHSDELARPSYTQVTSTEYLDYPCVLDRKADLLVALLSQAKQTMVYAGAGISTSSGIWDYASNAKGSLVQPKRRALTHAFIESLQPTPGHRVLAALEKRGHIAHWLQQNHDGLAQKAGFPAEKVNEIHGAWLAPKGQNPVVKMSGNLRDDLFAWMLEWEKRADFVLAVGTSFSGLNADRCANSCAERHMAQRKGLGLAIVSIQKTPMDTKAALRVFCRIDDFMLLVAQKMALTIDPRTYTYRSSIDTAEGKERERRAKIGDS